MRVPALMHGARIAGSAEINSAQNHQTTCKICDLARVLSSHKPTSSAQFSSYSRSKRRMKRYVLQDLCSRTYACINTGFCGMPGPGERGLPVDGQCDGCGDRYRDQRSE